MSKLPFSLIFEDEAFKAQASPLLRGFGDPEEHVAMKHGRLLAKVIAEPLRQGVLSGDIASDIFRSVTYPLGQIIEYPLDFIAPGTESELVAFTIPKEGHIPDRQIEGDFVTIPTYEIAGSIGWLLRYARDANWDIVGRAMEALMVQFIKKTNDDAWHTLISAGVDRNVVVYDANAQNAQLTKRLFSILKVVMRRNGGGNSSSVNRTQLTDVYMSPEAMEDIRNWNVDQIDQFTREKLFNTTDNVLDRIFGINLHVIDELGDDQEYEMFYENQLAGTLPSGDVEILVGVNKNRGSFIKPERGGLEIFPDPTMHRGRKAGYYGWKEHGFAVLDNRDVIIASI